MNKKLNEQILNRVLIFDGAMGTNIQNFNLTIDDFHGHEGCNEYLVMSRPDVIEQIHASFLEVGCQVIETNTFGANRVVLSEYQLESLVYELNKKAAQLAVNVARQFSTAEKPRFVSGSMGPGTRLPSLGHISFDELRSVYTEQALGLIDGGVDLFQIETGQDLLQLKAALLGTFDALKKRKKEIPVIIQVTMERTGRMLLGTDMNAVITTFEPFPIFGLGLNCATGPKAMSEHVRTLSQYSPFPVSVLPNAGLPKLKEGKYIYDLTPDELASDLKRFVIEFGVQMVGGCCGTTPDHLAAVVRQLENVVPAPRQVKKIASVASIYISQPLHTEPKPLLIGERTNANGSKKFRQLLLSNDYDGIVDMALEQQAEQAHVLDLCVAYAGRDEVKDMTEVVERLNRLLEIPLMIDSTEVPVIEAALKRIGGRAIINSINLEDEGERAHKILKLAKEYGAAVVALTIDEKGMATTAERKLEIARKLFDLIITEHGLNPSDILFDPLTFTLASGDPDYYDAGIQTLEGIRLIKKEFPESFTMLGLSNISFGLKPKLRHYLNSVFLYHAVEAGLDAAILHAGKIKPLHQIPEEIKNICEDLIFNRRSSGYDPLQTLMQIGQDVKEEEAYSTWQSLPIEEKLKQHIILGKKQELEKTLKDALKNYKPLDIINRFLLDGMKIVGDLFGEGKMQLPFVLKSAEVMKQAVAMLEPYMEKQDTRKKGRIVLATVKGDVHDIGKNLVDIILSNNGYEVINLGIKQSVENIMDAIRRYKPDCVGMSGLLVKSTLIMKENLQIFDEQGIKLPVICGGAALNRKFVEQELKTSYRGPVFYGRDAMTGLSIMEKITSGKIHDNEQKDGTVHKIRAQRNETLIVKTEAAEEELRFDHSIPEPPFWGRRKITGIPLEALLPYLNKRVLFKGRWQLKGKMRDNITEFDPEKTLQDLLKEGLRKKLYDFKVVYGYFKANALDEKRLRVYDPTSNTEEIFTFPVQKKSPYLSLAKYFLPEAAGKSDVVAFHLVTVGRKLSDYVQQLFRDDEYFRYLLWHGLSVELAEALAEYWHKQIRIELTIHEEDSEDPDLILKGVYRGRRYSFGYPACPNLEDQKRVFNLLKPADIGVGLTEEYQLVPEQSTSAIIVHHPQARYFAV